MDLPAALAFSSYAQRALAAHPDLAETLHGTLDAPFDWTTATTAVDAAVAAGDPDAVGVVLRRLRRQVFVHTLARDLTRRATLREVVGTITRLAEVAIAAAVAVHHHRLAADHGEPRGADTGAPQQLIVVGMGKLGGGELNVSSDVDLVFVYPEEGETDGPRRLANREFFDRLGRRVIATLQDATADGYVFRVDMRLRPYGDSGPLTAPFSALEQYLITQGRAWERYAWLKARPLTGSRHDELDDLVLPFVYRKYLDYDAYEGLRDIHRQIREQERRRDYQANVKLGPGGIREVEFVAQALQIVRGGREPALRVRGTLAALPVLAARRLIPEAGIAALTGAYVFLRDVEHRLQYRDDQQTQRLPELGPERELLARSLDFADAASFDATLARHRAAVEAQFALVLGDGAATTATNDPARPFAALWDDPVANDATRAPLAAADYPDPDALLDVLSRARSGGRYQQLPALSRDRFDRLVPTLLGLAATERVPGADPQAVFLRLFALLEAVSRRSAYLALLIEHPPLLPRLAQLMGASAWAADYLTRHPILLDELLDARILLEAPDWTAWRDELERQLDAAGGDAEREMDTLRHFQHAQSFRLLAQDLGGQLTVERLADHLSALADVILAATLARCWRHARGADAPAPRFAIVGYGKLGGKELGYASDLDIVFLFDVDATDPDADMASTRYARLAQRINTWLSSNTAAGQLYDTDLRLRPDGAAGLMVSRLEAFRKYQRESAWTWEHQALTRARFVAGDAALGAAFEAERIAILRLPRDRAKLAADVIEMRRKLHDGHPNPTPRFDLKHDPGGMIDIEFAVQYLVLAHAAEHAELTRNLGNIALLGIAAGLGLIAADIARDCADAYRDYRRLQHQIRLTGAAHARVEPAPMALRRERVAALWQAVLGTASWPAGARGGSRAATARAGDGAAGPS